MADTKISNLPAASDITGADIPIVQGGTNKKAAASLFATDISGKQATLVSGTNIKTIRGVSVLGSGDLYVDVPVTTAASTNAYTITDTYPAAYTTGEKFVVIFTNANTTASTLNRNGLGAKAIKKNGAGALSSGDLIAGAAYLLVYDGTNYQVVGAVGSGSGLPSMTGHDGEFLTNDGASTASWAVPGGIRVYDVEAYGALHDGIVISANVTATSGSATISVTGGATPFVVGDVGKVILISGAGAGGAPFRGTIATYISSTSVTLNTTAGTNVTLAWMCFGTDDTAAVQAAINAAHTAGGGTVYLKKGIYIINGALQTSISGTNPNSQIYFPSEADTSYTFSQVRLLGESSVALDQYNGEILTTGTVFISTLISVSGTAPAVFGTKGATGNFQNFNFSDIYAENIHVVVTSNKGAVAPYLSGWSLFQASAVSMRRVSVTTEVGLTNTVTPSGGSTFGFALSSYNNNGPNTFSECFAGGVHYGAIVGEHSIIDNFYCIGCYRGFVFLKGYHTITGKILTHRCNTQLYFPSASSFLGQDNSATNAQAIIDLLLETEINADGKWYDTVYLLDDFNLSSFGRLRLATGDGPTGAKAANVTMLGMITATNGLNLNVIPSQSVIPRQMNQAGEVVTTHSGATGLEGVIQADSGLPGTAGGQHGVVQAVTNQANTSLAPVGVFQHLNSNIGSNTSTQNRMLQIATFTDGAINTSITYIRGLLAGTLTALWEWRPTGISVMLPFYLGQYANDAAADTAAGGTAAKGAMYYNTSTDKIKVKENATWKTVTTT